jgi:hypothetical protein
MTLHDRIRAAPSIALVSLQRIGCSHPCAVEIGTFVEPYMHWCINPNCGAKWQETEWRKQVWP